MAISFETMVEILHRFPQLMAGAKVARGEALDEFERFDLRQRYPLRDISPAIRSIVEHPKRDEQRPSGRPRQWYTWEKRMLIAVAFLARRHLLADAHVETRRSARAAPSRRRPVVEIDAMDDRLAMVSDAVERKFGLRKSPVRLANLVSEWRLSDKFKIDVDQQVQALLERFRRRMLYRTNASSGGTASM